MITDSKHSTQISRYIELQTVNDSKSVSGDNMYLPDVSVEIVLKQLESLSILL